MKTLQDLFLDQLGDMYYAEKQLVRALPKMAKAATHDELKNAFQSHLKETEDHVTKVESVFDAVGAKAKAKKCEAILGLLEEGDDIASDHRRSPTINAALICAAQKVEHYEMASYGCLREWAELLGNSQAASLLQEILDQEKAADDKLTELARSRCNASAEGESADDSRPSPRRGVRPAMSSH